MSASFGVRSYQGPGSEPLGHWSQQSACRDDERPDDWHPVGFVSTSAGATRAMNVCQRLCPVRQQCLDYALSQPGISGIWGGYSETERRALRPGHRVQPPLWQVCPAGRHEMRPTRVLVLPPSGARLCKACRDGEPKDFAPDSAPIVLTAVTEQEIADLLAGREWVDA